MCTNTLVHCTAIPDWLRWKERSRTGLQNPVTSASIPRDAGTTRAPLLQGADSPFQPDLIPPTWNKQTSGDPQHLINTPLQCPSWYFSLLFTVSLGCIYTAVLLNSLNNCSFSLVLSLLKYPLKSTLLKASIKHRQTQAGLIQCVYWRLRQTLKKKRNRTAQCSKMRKVSIFNDLVKQDTKRGSWSGFASYTWDVWKDWFLAKHIFVTRSYSFSLSGKKQKTFDCF